jgi:hypothetical protein
LYRTRPLIGPSVGAVVAAGDKRNAQTKHRNYWPKRVMPRAELNGPSKSLLPAIVESDLSVRKPRRLPRQLNDRLALLAAISERHQEKAFIAFLHNFNRDWGLRHGNKT